MAAMAGETTQLAAASLVFGGVCVDPKTDEKNCVGCGRENDLQFQDG